ncbi:DUF424 domain-containing protein [Salarchaeum sp. JOR-1]|uniref:DUF424 domain-containing protein n=1 Tax=Salarchaeum sp. JOR-1 TaxID=2599399 RepID=UPI00119851CB|nr:DUF424 domain-containing protein [Salarchaeum sp. JOR-1]QDX40167.1 DUF424 domain-containing protein [Salarchaeum sp. JOR-1]
MIVSERQTDQGLLVTVCDTGLIGETFEDGDVSLTVTEEFYGGDEVDEAGVLDSLTRASVANLVGTRTVEFAIDEGFVDEAVVLDIADTRHAQVLRL